MKSKKNADKKRQNKIKLISDNLLRMQTRNLLLKHQLDKIPESIDKYLVLRDYYKTEESISDIEMQFSMIKYLLRNVKFEG